MKNLVFYAYLILFSGIPLYAQNTAPTDNNNHEPHELHKTIQLSLSQGNHTLALKQTEDLIHLYENSLDTIHLIQALFTKVTCLENIRTSHDSLNADTKLIHQSQKDILRALQLINQSPFNPQFISYDSLLRERVSLLISTGVLPNEAEKKWEIEVASRYNNYLFNHLATVDSLNEDKIFQIINNRWKINLLKQDYNASIPLFLKALPLLKMLDKEHILIPFYINLAFEYTAFDDQYGQVTQCLNAARSYAYSRHDTLSMVKTSYYLGHVYRFTAEHSTIWREYWDEALRVCKALGKRDIYELNLHKILYYYAVSENIEVEKLQKWQDDFKTSTNPKYKDEIALVDAIILLRKKSSTLSEISQAIDSLIPFLKKVTPLKIYLLLNPLLGAQLKVKKSPHVHHFEIYKEILTTLSLGHHESIYKADAVTKDKVHQRKISLQKLTLENFNLHNHILLFTIFIIILLFIFGYIYFTKQRAFKRLQNNKATLQMHEGINTLELSMLNKQLDPNEIKNLIDSIAPELEERAPEAYQQMYQLFNITRASLNNKNSESLNIQLQQAMDLVELSQKMIAEKIDLYIHNPSNVQDLELPRLLIKNIVENAIKHGIKPKKAPGIINIDITAQATSVLIEIKDNGVSNTVKPTLTQKQESTGVGFNGYKKLFELLNKHNKEQAHINIAFSNTGTTVSVIMPQNYIYSISKQSQA